MKTDLSIVIPTWNGLSLLQQFLPSVIEAAKVYAAQTAAQIEILLVDDGSTDETINWLTAHQQHLTPIQIRVLRNERNLGFSLTCNKGVEAARFPLIFLLNNDVELDLKAIAPLVEHFTDASVFAVHCRTLELDSGKVCGTGKIGDFKRGFIRVHQSYAIAHKLPPGTQSIEASTSSNLSLPYYSMFAGGGAAMFDREKFLLLGGFEQLLSPFYWEDVELSYRAWKQGFSVLYEPRSVVHHRLSSTIGKLNQRKVRTIEQRNRIMYHWIHLHDRRLLASHLIWLTVLAVTAPLRCKPLFILACVESLKKLPAIQKRRQQERAKARRSDREVLGIFVKMKERADLMIYDKISELPSD